MTNFVLLFNGGGMPEDEAEIEKVMKAWMAWYEKLGSALVDQGNPFAPAVKSITPTGSVSNGPVGEMASGYSIIKAGSLDEAVTLAKSCPMLEGVSNDD